MQHTALSVDGLKGSMSEYELSLLRQRERHYWLLLMICRRLGILLARTREPNNGSRVSSFKKLSLTTIPKLIKSCSLSIGLAAVTPRFELPRFGRDNIPMTATRARLK